MPLVQPPRAESFDPIAVHLIQGDVSGVYRSLQHRSVKNVGLESRGLDELSGSPGFLPPLVGQININPSGKEVLLVPCRIAVAKQD